MPSVWPNRVLDVAGNVLHIPLHRVVWLDCPSCAFSLCLIAVELVPVADGESQFPHAVVNHLS
jgi:hypothetical protein